MLRLAILGASGHGKVIVDIAFSLGYSDVVFFDDAWPSKSTAGRWPVLGSMDALVASLTEFHSVIVGIGDNRIRLEKSRILGDAGAPLASMVHPAAVVSRFSNIGLGSVICAGAMVSVDAALDAGVIVNTGATVDHDCRLAEGVHVAPGAHLSGDVHVGACSWVGVGACVKQGVHIGSDVMVGAGAVVITDIPDGLTVVGNPARPTTRK
jgi:sugar O-acyltransferase (sialic acid O-acetyltransferase NeuD family)